MKGICCVPTELTKDFDCKVEPTESGITVTLTAKDPQKAEALKTFIASSRILCGEDCCQV